MNWKGLRFQSQMDFPLELNELSCMPLQRVMHPSMRSPLQLVSYCCAAVQQVVWLPFHEIHTLVDACGCFFCLSAGGWGSLCTTHQQSVTVGSGGWNWREWQGSDSSIPLVFFSIDRDSRTSARLDSPVSDTFTWKTNESNKQTNNRKVERHTKEWKCVNIPPNSLQLWWKKWF